MTEIITAPTAPGSPPPDDVLLEVRDLRTYFHVLDGTVPAVDGVSYSLKRGESLGIVGESGSGKSVSALTMMRLLDIPPAEIRSGEIWFDGKEILSMPMERMRAIRGNDMAMIFQEPLTSLNPVFTIGDQIAEQVQRHKKVGKKAAWDRAIESLQLVGIPSPERRVKQYPHEMSGGMRQRVMIAMALSCEPKLLIADEPTTALDVTIQAQILELLKTIQDRTDSALLLITHDLGVVAEMVDDVIVMYAGQVVEHGTVDEVLVNPRAPYTMGLLESIPTVEKRGGRLSVQHAARLPLRAALPVRLGPLPREGARALRGRQQRPGGALSSPLPGRGVAAACRDRGPRAQDERRRGDRLTWRISTARWNPAARRRPWTTPPRSAPSLSRAATRRPRWTRSGSPASARATPSCRSAA
jgi:ABC-type dipeptide/oligopeptide/nickel transport system ATPase component